MPETMIKNPLLGNIFSCPFFKYVGVIDKIKEPTIKENNISCQIYSPSLLYKRKKLARPIRMNPVIATLKIKMITLKSFLSKIIKLSTTPSSSSPTFGSSFCLHPIISTMTMIFTIFKPPFFCSICITSMATIAISTARMSLSCWRNNKISHYQNS